MEWTLAAIALALIAVGAVSRRIDGTPLTPAIMFVGIGLLAGTQALDLLEVSPTGGLVKLLAEATLTVVLFADAARIDLPTLRREYNVPARLLGIGLPLTIALGALLAAALFGALSFAEALVLAVFRLGNHGLSSRQEKRGDGGPSPLILFLVWPDTGSRDGSPVF